MRANEFVEKFGLDTARNVIKINNGFLYFEVIDNTPCYSSQYYADCNQVSLEDLRRIVESHELVESMGDLEFAKDFIKITGSTLDHTLEKAVADVESCK